MANVIWMMGDRPSKPDEVWEWPAGFYAGPSKKIAAMLVCKEACSERGMNNGPVTAKLQVVIFDYSRPNKKNPGEPCQMLAEGNFFDRMETAIMFAQTFLEQHPDWQPSII